MLLPNPPPKRQPESRLPMTAPIACLSEQDRALNRLASEIQNRHRSHLREFRIEVVAGGIILLGRSVTFYGKQIALHEVCSGCECQVLANRIEVQSPSIVDE